MHSGPVPINVRCYSNSDIIVRRSEVTLRANSVISRCDKRLRYSSTRRRVRRIVGASIQKAPAKPALFIDWRLTRRCAVA
jgi:hypothetical protein